MGKIRKTYPDSFKTKVAQEALESGKSVAEIATKYGIAPSMVTMWKKALVNGELNNKELKRTQKELEEKEKALESALTTIGKQQLMIDIMKKKLNIKDEIIIP